MNDLPFGPSDPPTEPIATVASTSAVATTRAPAQAEVGSFDDATRVAAAPTPASLPPTTQPPFYKRTVPLAAFAGVGVLTLAIVGGYALSRSMSPSHTAAAAPTTVTESPAAPVAPPTYTPLPPPPAQARPQGASTPTTSSVPPMPTQAPPVLPPETNESVAGTIASKSGTNWVINSARGPVPVAINAGTAFKGPKKGGGFEVGDPVTVQGSQIGSTYLADTVTSAKKTSSDSNSSSSSPSSSSPSSSSSDSTDSNSSAGAGQAGSSSSATDGQQPDQGQGSAGQNTPGQGDSGQPGDGQDSGQPANPYQQQQPFSFGN